MAVSLITYVLSLVAISICSVVVLSEENIPIIAWSNSESLVGFHPFEQEPLYDSISNIAYNNEKIILFTQEKMSFDDLAKYGGLYGSEGVLKNIKNYVSTSASFVMLSVPYQPDFVTFLAGELAFSYELDRIKHFSAKDIMTDDTEFVNSNCKLCVISLPEASSSSTSDQASHLAESDKFIGSVMGKDVVQKDKYIAMITAKYSQMHSKQQPTLNRAARAVPTENCTIPFRHCTDNQSFPEYNNTCYFLMRFDEIVIQDPLSNSTLTILKANSTNTTTASPASCSIEKSIENSIENSTVNGTYRSITVTYTGVMKNEDFDPTTEVIIKYLLPFNQSSPKLPNGFWTLELNVTLNEKPYLLTYKKEGVPPYPLAIPKGASFHCSNATYCIVSTGDLSQCNHSSLIVIMRGLQVELFDSANKTEFSIAYDCEPYFSAATWMGVFTLSVLLPILIVGFFLIFQTQTMDRFDDPREPALQTTVLD